MSDTTSNDPTAYDEPTPTPWRYITTVADLIGGLDLARGSLELAAGQTLTGSDVELSIGTLNLGYYWRLVADPYTQSVWIQIAQGTGPTNTPPSADHPTHV